MSLQEEVGRFERLSRTWWNARGPMRPLHVLNALRLRWGARRDELSKGVAA